MREPGREPAPNFRQTMVRLLGRWPERCDLDARTEARDVLGNVMRERVTYLVEPGERVPAYVFVPKDLPPGARRSGIFAHHQHAGQFHLGKSEVAGLTGNPEQRTRWSWAGGGTSCWRRTPSASR